jgi:probable rRNA maturation factor
MQIILDNQTGFSLQLEQIESIARQMTLRQIELIICDDKTIEEINAEYRGKAYPTDVLSFPLEGDFPMLPLGSIVISSDHVTQKAHELGHTPDDELQLLFIHGLLHLLGYDHEQDKGEMRTMEERLIRELGLPESLIVRTEKE